MTDRQKVAYMYKYVMQVSDQLQKCVEPNAMRTYIAGNMMKWIAWKKSYCWQRSNFFAHLERDLLNILTDQWIPAGSKSDKKRLERWKK